MRRTEPAAEFATELAATTGVTKKLLTTRDVAEMNDVDRKTVQRAVRNGKLKAHVVNDRGDFRFLAVDVEDWRRNLQLENARRIARQVSGLAEESELRAHRPPCSNPRLWEAGGARTTK
jgi:excisionase family DNA binding protein